MSFFDDQIEITTVDVNGHEYKSLNQLNDDHVAIVEDVAKVIPGHYIDPESTAYTLERLGKPAFDETCKKK